MNRFLVILLAALAATATGCGSVDTINSDQVAGAALFRSYRAVFSEEDSRLWLSAKFTVGGVSGTTVRLKEPSKISTDAGQLKINDGDKRVLNISGTYYSKILKVKKPAETYKFIWTKDDGTKDTAKLDMPEMAAIISPSANGEHSRTEHLEIKFDGVKINDDTRLTVILKTKSKNKQPGEKSIITESTASGDDLLFSPTDLEKFPAGKAMLYISTEKKVLLKSNDEDKGGYLTSSVKSKGIPITITR